MTALLVPHLRVARPVTDPARSAEMYCRGLGFDVLGQFKDHGGFDGMMVGHPSAGYHLELVRASQHSVRPTPTVEDLLVFYIPNADEWQNRCDAMLAAGFRLVAPFNLYWSERGQTYADHDDYRTVLERANWPAQARPNNSFERSRDR
jgi:hypothetical protein